MNPAIRTASRGLALAVLCATWLMVVIDIAVTNVALPSIQADLDVSQGNLQWVVTAYGLMLGGCLMLGGRLADLRGRKVVLMTGVLAFALASLAAGLSPNFTFLVVARGVQGLAAALISPAALSIITTLFAEGEERNRALGIWGGMGASGAALGVVLGGLITDTVGWQWIFFINVPIALVLTLVIRNLFTEERPAATGRLDLPGAVSLTAGLLLVVYALHEAGDRGWTDGVTLALFGGSAALLGLFAGIEARSEQPLVRLGIFRKRTLTASNTVNLMLFGGFFGFAFSTTLYMQQVVGWSPLEAGIAWMPFAVMVAVAAGIGSALVNRLGVKPMMVSGIGLAVAGLLLMTRVSVDGSYFGEMFPAFVLAATGMGFAMVSVQVAAFSGVAEHEAGLASGIVNTTQEIGGALGVAVLASVALSRTNDLLGGADGAGVPLPVALTEGFQSAYAAGAVLAAVGLMLAVTLIRTVRVKVLAPVIEEEAA
jgi:EmrB/QacA subfamily drug resistance transporter